jgi:hypothetical protein
MFAEYLSRWGLTPDGDPTLTRNSRLLPVRWRGAAAMLKVVLETVAKAGNGLMAWWRGEGAAHVLATDGDAILLERAEGKASQADFVQRGRDDEASRICAVVTRPHAAQWFAQFGAGRRDPRRQAVSAGAARDLLVSQREVAVRHGISTTATSSISESAGGSRSTRRDSQVSAVSTTPTSSVIPTIEQQHSRAASELRSWLTQQDCNASVCYAGSWRGQDSWQASQRYGICRCHIA